MIYLAWYHSLLALGTVHTRDLLKCWLDKEEKEPSGTRMEPITLTSLVITSGQLRILRGGNPLRD